MAGTSGLNIAIDHDAAGWAGVRRSDLPDDNLEFGAVHSTTELGATGGEAAAHIDLLTTVMHELGHVLGLDHSHEPGDLMDDAIDLGIRRLPDADDAAQGARGAPDAQASAVAATGDFPDGVWHIDPNAANGDDTSDAPAGPITSDAQGAPAASDGPATAAAVSDQFPDGVWHTDPNAESGDETATVPAPLGPHGPSVRAERHARGAGFAGLMEAPSNVGISDEFPDAVWHIDRNAGENGDNEFVCELHPQSPAIADTLRVRAVPAGAAGRLAYAGLTVMSGEFCMRPAQHTAASMESPAPVAQRRVGEIAVAEPFLSEIRLMSFVFAPKGWALCNGQLLPINQNQALFSLLGTTFGGDGRVNFALPDLRGRVPIHVGSGHTLGEKGGEQAHTLSIAELPTHTHVADCIIDRRDTCPSPRTTSWRVRSTTFMRTPASLVALNAGSVTNVGGSQPHLNMQPFLTLSFCIALQGIFPSPN